MPDIWTFHSAGAVIFGPGAIARIGEQAQRHRWARVLVVTDRTLVGAGLLNEVQTPLTAAGVEVGVFDDGEPEPSLAAAERAIALAREFKPEAILGLGGGSNMDLAKVTAVAFAHGGSPRDYLGEELVPGPVTPTICVPTTAGTGSEVSGSGVLTDQENQLKVAVVSNFMRPKLSIVDPRLTMSCPRYVTAESGIDALTHAIEAYTAVDNEKFPLPVGEKTIYQGRNPMGDAFAEKSIALVGEHLVRAVNEPQNLDARTGMSLAALLGGLAFANVGVALTHALEYPVGGATHCSHGAGNGLLLPFVMRYNLPARVPQFARIAQLLGRNTAGMSESAAAEDAIAAVEALKQAIGIPPRLRDLGVREDQLRTFAEKAATIKRILRVNPRYPTVEEIVEIFKSAL
jgi:alcohol dehydrogenase